MKKSNFKTAIEVLREKADVYEEHPNYNWLLPEHEPFGVGHLIADELRSTASLLEFINERQPKESDDSTQMAEMYSRVKLQPEEGSIAAAIRVHSQACGLVAFMFNVHPDTVAEAVKEHQARGSRS